MRISSCCLKIACFAVIGAIFTNFAMAFSKRTGGRDRVLSDIYIVDDTDDDVIYHDGCHYHEWC